MKMRYSLLFCWALLPGVAHALGLGNIELESALNEPLKARIELLSATAEDLNSLNTNLADEAAFRRAGIPRDFILTQLQFSIKESETGPDFILVTSADPIREPFLHFLVEINWSNGRLYREYTVLLDPPIYAADKIPRADKIPGKVTPPTLTAPQEEHTVVYYPEYKPPVTAKTSGISQSSGYGEYTGGDYGPVASGETLWSIARTMRPDTSVSIQQMMLALLRANPEAFINGNINGLKRGHVLKTPDISDAQSLAKIEAFQQAELQNSMWQEARQAAAVAPPVRPEGTPSETAPQPVVAEPEVPAEKPVEPIDKPAEETQEETQAVEPAIVEVQPELRLVAPAESGQSASQGGAVDPANEALAKELAIASETLEALTQENMELKDKIMESDVIVDDLKRLITLKETELATLQQQVANRATQQPVPSSSEPAPDVQELETTVSAESTKPQAATAEPEPVPVKPAQKKGPSILTAIKAAVSDLVVQLKNNVLYIIISLAAVAVLFAVFNFVQRKRNEAEFVSLDTLVNGGDGPTISVESEDVTDMNLASQGEVDQEAITLQPGRSTSSSEKTQVMGAAEAKPREMGAAAAKPREMGAAAAKPKMTGSPLQPAVEAPDEEMPGVDEDPLEEVNVFLAYEHFDQAEEFVKNALEKAPDNPAFHVKLLEVYYTANNRKAYEEAARVLHDKVQGKGDYWGMAQAMWQVLSPNRELFAEPAAGEETADASAEKETGGILNIAGDGEVTSSKLDFDLDTTAGGSEADDNIDEAAIAEPEMLDVTAAADDSEVLEFSTDADDEIAPADEKATVSTATDDNSLEFSLDGEDKSAEEEQSLAVSSDEQLQEDLEVSAQPAGDDNALDFSLDLDEKSTEEEQSPEVSLDEQLQEDLEVSAQPAGDDNALDFSLDLDEKSTGEEQSPDISLDEQLQEDVEEAFAQPAGDDNALDFSLVLENKQDEEDHPLDMSMQLKEEIELPAAPPGDDNALDISLDTSEPADDDKTAIPLDNLQQDDSDILDVTAAINIGENNMDGSASGSSLLDVTSTLSLDDLESQSSRKYADTKEEDLMDVSKPGSKNRGSDLLDVTSAPDLSKHKKEDLLDVTFTGSTSTREKDNGEAALDFELAPDQPVPGDESAIAFDGIDITASTSTPRPKFDLDVDSSPESEEDAFAMDMDSTMKIPNKRSTLTDKQEENEEDDKTLVVPRKSEETQSDDDEIATQLDLAKAYIELGNADSAKTILDEIIAIGNDGQRRQAQALLGQIA